jgi:hypothetical protein
VVVPDPRYGRQEEALFSMQEIFRAAHKSIIIPRKKITGGSAYHKNPENQGFYTVFALQKMYTLPRLFRETTVFKGTFYP